MSYIVAQAETPVDNASLSVVEVELEKRKAVLREIKDFGYLRENWDGYGAIPVFDEVINRVLQLVQQMPESLFDFLNIYDIYPNPNGTITLDFCDSLGKVFVSIEVGRTKAGFYTNTGSGEPYLQGNLQIGNVLASDLSEALEDYIQTQSRIAYEYS